MKNLIRITSATRAEADEEALFLCRLPVLIFGLLMAGLLFFAGCGDNQGDATVSTASDPAPPSAPVSPTTIAADDATVAFNSEEDRVDLHVAVAESTEARSRGLMYVDEMAEDEGMIFVWNEPVTGGFWMKNTYIPLSIAFVSSDLRIIDIQDMEPLSLEPHEPAGPYLYAIEANQGFFERNGIAVGSPVELDGV
jgi:hypothetical protein